MSNILRSCAIFLSGTVRSDSEKLTLFIHEVVTIHSYELLGIGERAVTFDKGASTMSRLL